MTLTEIRTLLKQHGYKTNEPVDRIDVQRYDGVITGIDVMFSNGTIDHLKVTEA